MKPSLPTGIALLALVLATAQAQTTNALPKKPADKPASSIAGPTPSQAPPLTQCLKIQQDPVGKNLQETFVWTDLPREAQGVAAGFRKTFDLTTQPSSALLHLFADARYILWVNGTYVDRGPARFQPNGPEYDTIDIARYLKPGKNVVAMVVAGNLSGGKVMRHAPGLTASLEVEGKSLWKTDATWRWSDRTRYRKTSADWANLGDTLVDAQVEDGDWTSADYNDSAWKPVVAVSGSDWGPLTARRIPMLAEKEVPFTLQGGAALPVTLNQGQKLEFTTGRIVQAYPVISLTAEAGTELTIEPYGVHYIAKAGPQTHFTLDTRGITKGALAVTKGTATITGLKLVERLYPYERLASFQSDDPFLNRLWEMCARSCEVLSEDSYVDCADRERVEWMDDTPPGYDITRTAMAGPAGADGKKIYSDPRLLAELVRRTALTLQPDGWVKAHTCSDRYDIHAKMEDRACDWVEGIRFYYEATGNASAVKEIWPTVTAQMDYFLGRRTAKGLVSARDWVVWSNPTGYLVGQATPLNCFVYRALADASVLAGVVGDAEAAQRYTKASTELKQAINRELWDEKSGSYLGGYFNEGEVAAITSSNKAGVAARLRDGYFPPTLEANLFALDRGVVPDDRRKRVIDAVMEQEEKGNIGGGIMTAYYLYKQLYALDGNANDERVLDLIRRKFQAMVDHPFQCSWEGYSGGSKAHIYGMYPGYLLSAYVLGVRREAPVAEKQLLIEPHLGNLKKAEGTVVTEFGPVTVSWVVQDGKLNGVITVPEGVTTTLAVPLKEGVTSVLLDGKQATGKVVGSRLQLPLTSGQHNVVAELPAIIPLPKAPDADVTSREDGEMVIQGKMAELKLLEREVPKNNLVSSGSPDLLSIDEQGVQHTGEGNNADAIHNGTILNGSGGDETANDGKTFRGYGQGSSLVFHLNTTTHPAGYDLSRIITFAGHHDERSSQQYAVKVAFVSAPEQFVPLFEASVKSERDGSEINVSAKNGGVLINAQNMSASHVAAVKFEFKKGPRVFNVYREICIVGGPSK
jgi:hypothetical protein